MQLKRNIAVLFCCLLVFAGVGICQDVTASISGTVTDNSGAVVANAKVTITNTDKSVVVKIVNTDAGGNYAAPYLPIGHYSVTVEAAGFQTYTQTGIELHVNDRYTMNANLQVGQAAQTITVEAAALQVDLQTQAAAGLISGIEVRELSLNNRVFEQLVTLQPGVSNGAGDQLYIGTTNPFGTVNRADFSVNGTRTTMNNWTIDGADNVDRGANLTLLNYPSVDAIAEFKVLRGNYNAEYGRAGGGQVNVATRSGASTFHGSAYEFFRNDALNANDYFAKRAQIQAKQPNKPQILRYNNPGFTIGGPLYIPGVYNAGRNKTFFFVSEEFRRVITYSTQQAFFPTTAEKSGQMQFPVCVGTVNASGTCTGATSTTVTNISPIAAAYVKDFWSHAPDPQDPLTHSIQLSGFRNVFNNRQDFVRIDHVFGPRVSVFGRYMHDTIPTIEPFGIFGPNSLIPGAATSETKSPGTTWVGRGNVAFSPTLLMEAGYSYSYGGIISRITGLINPANSPDVKATLPFTPSLQRQPTVSFLQTFSGVSGFGPYDDFNRNHTAFGNVTKVLGRHTFKSGVTYHHYQKTENNAGNNAGTFQFDSPGAIVPTGISSTEAAARRAAQAWANFLMGRVTTFTQASADLTPDIRAHQLELFGQDEFRIRQNLTLNYGVRYVQYRQPIDSKGELDNFDPRRWNPANAPLVSATTGLIIVDSAGNPTQGDPLNGIIIGGKNSPYGSKVANEDNNAFEPRIGVSWDPLKNGKTAVRAGYGISHDFIAFGNYELNIFSNPPFVQNITISNTSFDNPGSVLPSINAAPRTLRAIGLPFKTPYVQQWSLDLQQELTADMLLDVGYYASKGSHLPGFIDLNQPLPGAYISQLGISAPITAGTATTRLNAIRPFRGYGPISDFVDIFNSNYNSLQTSFQKRWRDGSLVKLSYTWAHNLGDVDPTTPAGYSTSSNSGVGHTAPQNTYNIPAEYGPTSLDRRNVFSGDFVYNLPFFRTQQGVIGHALGGWEISGIVTFNSGIPLTPRNNIPAGASAAVDFAGQGCLGSSPCIVSPNQVGDPNAGAPHTIAQWFNTSAFVPNTTPGAPGNARKGSIIAPGFQRVDLSLFKNIKITERVGTQFRFETFNTLNHTNFNAVNTQFGSALFGQVTNDRGPRLVQLGLKVSF
jgi:hypothetical protein